MSAAMLTADWFLLGRDAYFRKLAIFYTMQWSADKNLENFLISSASYGGPIALRRNDQKFVKIQGATGQPIISIFSSSGRQIASFKWTKRSIVCMGWSNDEKLVCIQEDGMVVIHDMFGKYLHTFNISQKVLDDRVIDARIFTSPQNSTGIAVLTSTFKIFVINNIHEPKTRQLSEMIKSHLQPTSWAVISEDQHNEVLIAREKELFRLKQDEQHTSTILEPDITNNYLSILDISVSFNARHVALFTDSGYLWLGASNLRTKYCEIDTNQVHKPRQLVWCGTEAVIAYWAHDQTVLIVGRDGQKVVYYYDSPVHLAPEIDGVRIISNGQHELVQRVPNVVQKIFRINSTDPGSFLLEASKQYQKGSHRANEYICLVRPDLEKAVEQCIEAAAYEFDTEVQKMLIRAAQFGKCFIPHMNSDSYVKMIRLLRVLNAVRDTKIGIPLTSVQLKYLTEKTLLDRLIARKEYYLALQIANYMQMPLADGASHILVHWAKYKVGQLHLDEDTIARDIAAKLGCASAISYAEIAESAAQSGRRRLAIRLLDYEWKARDQVGLLLKLGENTPALIKAIESGDTELIYGVILKLREGMPLGPFKMEIRNFPVAKALYIKYCKEYNAQALDEIYEQEDDFGAQAERAIVESLQEKNKHMCDSFLNKAIEAYKAGRKDLNASICDEYLKLVRFQRQLDEKTPGKYIGKSINETCKLLLAEKDVKVAEKFKNDYKISEKRWWWLRIEHLAENGAWEELEKFSRVKRSPIGYAPFVDVCLARNMDEAIKYLPKVGDDLKVKYCIKAGCLEEAAQAAFEQKDLQSLWQIMPKCQARKELADKVANYIAQLDKR